jgi:hypothetical protein
MKVLLVVALCAVAAVAGAMYPKSTLSAAKSVANSTADVVSDGAKMGKDAANKKLAETSSTPAKK